MPERLPRTATPDEAADAAAALYVGEVMHARLKPMGHRFSYRVMSLLIDLDRLEGGDDYDRKIRANVGRCSFFLPVISATTQRRHEAYFRREWSYAVDRARNIAEGAVFILPVCIDATPEAEALVPEQFKALHIVRLAGGEPSPEFLRRLQDLFNRRRS